MVTSETRAEATVEVQDVRVPRLIYGTAWKEERTAALTLAALEEGFRGIDTANQRRHYHEAGVGEAVKAAFSRGIVRREDLFLQTKFTHRAGQDHRLPYDADAPIETQVRQSIERSLKHLDVDRLDAYLLHGSSTYPGLGEADWRAWQAMEDARKAGLTRLIGVSNVILPQLHAFYERARVRPALVQNRCFTRPHADRDVRQFCAERGLAYEGFSLLTAHPALLAHPLVAEIAARHDRTPAQVILRYSASRDILVLTGTTSREHMRQDLDVLRFALDDEELALLDRFWA